MTPPIAPRHRNRRVRKPSGGAAIVLGVVGLLVACGDATTGSSDSTTGSSDSTTSSSDDGTATDGSDKEGLQVQLSGTVSGTTLCPGNTRPCVILDGDPTIDGEPVPPSELVRVTGTLAGGVLEVDVVESIPSALDWLVDHCDDKGSETEFLALAETSPEESGVEEGGELEDYDQLGLYQLSIPDSYAVRWLTPRQIIHLGVVGEAEHHRQALDELGIGGFVCVVGGFKRIQTVLDEFATGPLSVESGAFVPAFRWSVAERSDSMIVLFGRSDQGDFADIDFERRDGLWQARGWGGCHVIVDAPGFGSTITILDPDREPDPDSTVLPVLIMERNCASGRAPADREVLPVVVETDSTIEIVTLVEPVTGGADCPGNPWHPITVTLRQAIGDREIFDGQSPPPVERTWPPSAADLAG